MDYFPLRRPRIKKITCQNMIHRIGKQEKAGSSNCNPDDLIVFIFLDPLEIEDDGELDDGGNIKDSCSKMKRHLEALHKTKDYSEWERTKYESEDQSSVEDEECKMTDDYEEVVDIRSHLKYLFSFVTIALIGLPKNLPSFINHKKLLG